MAADSAGGFVAAAVVVAVGVNLQPKRGELFLKANAESSEMVPSFSENCGFGVACDK